MSRRNRDEGLTEPNARLRRLLQPKSGRSFVVALDHAFFAVPADLPAIEDLAAVLDAVTAVGPDGVLMSAGQARLLADVEGRDLCRR